MSQRSQTVLLLAFLVIVWGINWPLSKIALTYAPPLLFAGIRTVIAGIILIIAALPKWKQLEFRRLWPVYLASAVLSIVFYYGFQTIGLQYVPSGLFSAIVFLQPVLLGIFAWIWLGESMYGLKIFGLLLGFAGVAALSIGGFTGSISAAGVLLALASALCWALGTVYMKRNAARVDMLWLTAMQIMIGGLILLGAGSVTESWSAITWSSAFIVNTLFIAVFVIALGWMVYFKLINEGEAGKVGSFTFLIPLISIGSSVVLLHERITLNLIAGMVLIVGSILLVNINLGRKRRLKPSL
ncbi:MULTISPECIES: DMT family transporter [unclassified Paenibacillus]|uniref:DMT family transporter n=1 Tax=unclassified Paenibacillus TaxID=185978 RepID=UPI00240582C4|nr:MULTISPECIES: DMT family transporter [unclassified Paenibacillus]MDF9839962.1 O-acetylserine/cysteine efflux transporter [Paenibacillus sp. PastF-2]MDF9846544.1 O-acetylserine/cysteine efflux transporter [Paenibacillus sp. PastM-2]MDF9853108.1 O-acetylserine/cysteine efflux transporter [Paenibacillus sp. PastF-1]MDH6478388.1 O-acetylserine/cysteine efflux transporter [Paenibacillus sp. PastH-2]MDH6506114.1 O-acetylserine/cysteine efflux transporter [Paenibacillus sp. PastM-3]